LRCVVRLHDRCADADAAGNTLASSMTVAPGFAATSCSSRSPLGHNAASGTPDRYGNTTVFAVPSPKYRKLTNTDFPSMLQLMGEPRTRLGPIPNSTHFSHAVISASP